MNTFLMKFLLALDSFWAALIYRDTAITISSEVGLRVKWGTATKWDRWLHDGLELMQPGHCEDAIKSDIARAQQALVYLTSQKGE